MRAITPSAGGPQPGETPGGAPAMLPERRRASTIHTARDDGVGSAARMALWVKGPLLMRGAPPGRDGQAVLELLAEALPEVGPYGVWGPVDVLAPEEEGLDEVLEVDALALGHHALYVIAHKGWRSPVAESPLDGALERVTRAADMLRLALERVDRRFEQLRVEPLLLVATIPPGQALPRSSRGAVITPKDLVQVLQRGELLAKEGEPPPAPVEEAVARALEVRLERLRRGRRPGYGSFAEEAAFLHRSLVGDLGQVAQAPEARAAIGAAYRRAGTALPLDDWKASWIEERAACWIISCAFARALEERQLVVGEPRVAGDGAEEAERRFLAEDPGRSTRDYLLSTLRGLEQTTIGAAILGEAWNPIWELPPSAEGATMLLGFFRLKERGRLRWSFAQGSNPWTDLYQSLSEGLKQEHGLIATPTFVEKLLIDLTLAPALDELAGRPVRVLDPACGSGEFLVLAFDRILKRLDEGDATARARAALDRVHGVDISAVGVLVSRIRLALAFLESIDAGRGDEVPALPIRVARADALLPATDTGDPEAASILGARYEVVVCDPPYATCKDRSRRERYRDLYLSASGMFSLTAPFIERCFQLAADGGFVGILSANSFMKRQFGRALIEGVLSHVDLTRVIDASGAYIPWRGTSTVILVGRNREPGSAPVRAVLAKRAELISPMHPEEGRVWSSLAAHHDEAGYEDESIQVIDLPRARLAKHPWSLGGGAAARLMDLLAESAAHRLEEIAAVRSGTRTGLDDVFIMPPGAPAELRIEAEVLRPIVGGRAIRDWIAVPEGVALAPFERDSGQAVAFDPSSHWGRFLWRYRTVLRDRHRGIAASQGPCWTWQRPPAPPAGPLRIVSPLVSRFNHFAVAPGDAIATHTVVMIDLPPGLDEEQAFALLGYLNSSTACFWLKQTCMAKTGSESRPVLGEPFFELNSLGLGRIPVPRFIVEPGALRAELATLARRLHETAQALAASGPAEVLASPAVESRRSLLLALADAQQRGLKILRQMVCDQEDLDWTVYNGLGLAPAELRRAPGSALPEQRPHLWTSAEAPARLDTRLAEPWKLRRSALLHDEKLRLLETTAHKRPFAVPEDAVPPLPDESEDEATASVLHAPRPRVGRSEVFRRRTLAACEAWLLDRFVDVLRAQGAPRMQSPSALAARVAALPGASAVASVYAGREEPDLAPIAAKLLAANAVPGEAVSRYTEEGLAKRTLWEQTWALQRREDAGEAVQPPAPPRYEIRDYRDATTWSLRGRLDVPRERFTAYVDANAEGGALLYGWADRDDALDAPEDRMMRGASR